MMDNILSFRGDTDTIGAIAGGIGAAYYGVPFNRKQIVDAMKPEGIFDEAITILGTR